MKIEKLRVRNHTIACVHMFHHFEMTQHNLRKTDSTEVHRVYSGEVKDIGHHNNQ